MSIMELMERDEGTRPRARRSFTAQSKAEIVELCQRGDRSIGQVSRDFDLTETAVREWVRQAERDAGTRGEGGLTSQERQELAVLRRENRRLGEDVETLKRATAFFVKETPCGWWSGTPAPSGQLPPPWARWENEAPATRAAPGSFQATPRFILKG
jgi:transposase